MHEERRDVECRQEGDEVEIPQALPNRLLHPPSDAERGELAGTLRVGEVARHPQLEEALAMGGRVARLESRRGEFLAQPGDLGPGLPSRELDRKSVV